MKTATIRTNHIFGTKNSYCTDVIYRGRILISFSGDAAQSLHNSGTRWARHNGFTHIKTIFG